MATDKPVDFKTHPTPGVFFPLGNKMVKVEDISYFGDSAKLIVK